MLKMRREGKEQKKNLLLKQQAPFAKPLPTCVKSSGEPAQDSPEWLIGEDWALLQVRGVCRPGVGPGGAWSGAWRTALAICPCPPGREAVT